MGSTVMLIGFPNLRQTYEYDCGPQALQSVLAYYGIEVRGEELIQRARTTMDGTKITDVQRVIEHYGLHCDVKEMTITEVKACIDKKMPVILLIQAWTKKQDVIWEHNWDDGHYVVAIGYDAERIIFEDPSAIFRTYLTHEELSKRWHDKDIDGKEYRNFGMTVYGKDPVSTHEQFIHMD